MKTRTKKNAISLLGVIACLILFSCEAPLKVTTDYDQAANFKNYSTFMVAVLQGEGQTVSELNRDRVVNAIKSEMIARGFKEDNVAPDMKVNAIAIMTSKQEISAHTSYYGYGGAYRPYGWGGTGGGGHTSINVDDYIDGSLIIDIVDNKTGKLVWQGVGNKKIDAPSKKPNETIPAAVKKIMAEFPPDSQPK